MEKVQSATTDATQLALFFGLTFAFSWVIWIPVAIIEPSIQIGLPVVVFGAFAPSIMGIVLTYRFGDQEVCREMWRRFFDLKRIGVKWFAFILLLFPAIALAGSVIETVLGGNQSPPDMATLTNPLRLLGFIFFMILGGPLAEEFGWRGFALDRLQAKWSALGASIILGVIWVAWHLPLFFMEATSQGAMGVGTLAFWFWSTQVVSFAVIYTWVYNNTGRSIFSAFMLHFMANSTFTIVAGVGGGLTLRTQGIQTVLPVLVAVIAVAVWGPKTFIRGHGNA